MDANEYQQLAARTLLKTPAHMPTIQEYMIIWNAVGVAGEGGELLNEVKKQIMHAHGLNIERLKTEVGDCFWYLASLCTTLGIDLGTVMQENVDKLKIRYPEGYNSQDSIRRVDVGRNE